LTERLASIILEGDAGTFVPDRRAGMLTSTNLSAEIRARRGLKPVGPPPPAFLVVDTESVPDGHLIRRVKYPGEDLSPEEAIERLRGEVRAQSRDGSDFIPVTFQYPVAVCVLRVGADYGLQSVTCLDTPAFRPDVIVEAFWKGVSHYPRARLVTFNGRGFDMPLLELAAFDRGISGRSYFASSRNRFQGNHVDLMDFLSNYGACRLTGGLNMLAKRLGQPGKIDVAGDQVYELWRAGRLHDINDYCMLDVLDTYFVFLRTRVLIGELGQAEERTLVRRARDWIAGRAATVAPLRRYLEHWPESAVPPLEAAVTVRFSAG
jgi:predicted PolB exonuclease-like 3'-5' exonuclease